MNAPTLSIPRIGAPWPGQGGLYAGIMRGDNGSPDYHLIVAPADAGEKADLTLGSYGKSEPGAAQDRDGLANTKALLESGNPHPAAEWAAGLEIDGLKDYYLPSRHELRLCFVNLQEDFKREWYWSSTQYSAHLAWIQWFDYGYQFLTDKSIEGRARAVRRLIIQPFNHS